MVNQPFICGTAGRRERIRSTSVNGIDYLEVLDHARPADNPPQQTLVVVLFQPVPASFTVRITGGVRFTKIGVLSALQLSTMALSADETTFYAQYYPAHRDRTLIVKLDGYGDYSTYTLWIDADGFDPILSAVEFSFKVQCKTDYDCEPAPDCPPAVVPAPAIDYLAKDYASFKRVILDRLSALSPDWTERDPADTGMMIAEMLAYTGDQLSYYQDAVGTEAYLGTARRRMSVRRHARLLEYFIHEGTNARAFVCFEIDDTVSPASGVLLPRINPDGSTTTVLTRTGPDARLAPNPQLLLQLLATAQPTVFEPMQNALLYPQHNRIAFYTWDDGDCCLPVGATAATLYDGDPNTSDPRLLLMAGDVLILQEELGHQPSLGVDLRRRQAVRLTSVTPTAKRADDQPTSARTPGDPLIDPVTGLRYVKIEWHADDALVRPLCVTSAAQPVPIAVAHGNAVLCDHGRTIGEPLSPSIVAPRYRPILGKPEVTHAVPLGTPVSAVAALAQDPHAAVPALTLVQPDGAAWKAAKDLLGASPTDREVVVEMDEGGYAELRFGDGQLGATPVDGLVATYRVGRGLAGNVGPDTLVQVMTSATGIVGVTNPLAAVGGLAPESLDDVRHYAPEAFRVQNRAVTEADYAACAMRHPEVHRAVATRRWTGSWYTVFLTVERVNDLPLDDTFRDRITAFIETFRLAGEDLEIEAPIYVPLAITLVACAKPGYFRDRIELALRRAFSTGRAEDGSPGFFAPERFAFGDRVYLSQVIARAMQIPGIDWVDPTDPRFVFRRANDADTGEVQRGYISMNRLEIAQCLSSPSEPERGLIEFVVEGGQ